MESLSDTETIFSGDSGGDGSPASSQSTDLFDDEDENMDVSDASDELTVADLGQSNNEGRIVRRTRDRPPRDRPPRTMLTFGARRSSLPAASDNAGEVEVGFVIQGGGVNESRTNRTNNGNSSLLNNNEIGIENDATRPSQSIHTTQTESMAVVGTSASSSNEIVIDEPPLPSMPSVNARSATVVHSTNRRQSNSQVSVGPNSSVSSRGNGITTRMESGQTEKKRDSLSDFQLPSKDKEEENVYDGDTDSDDEAQTCIICYEPWSNSGNHRLASLKCGHLFGSSCIQKWLKGQQAGKCPHCNAKAKKSDIRVIYAKALKAIDTSERDKALKDLEKEKELRRKTEIEKAQIMLKYQMAVEEVNRMRSQVKHQSSSRQSARPGSSSQQGAAPSLSGSYILEKTISVSIDGNSRILSYDYANHCLVASVPSPNQVLFAGFGVKKVSALMNWKTSQYLPMHSKPIRGMAFNGRNDGLLLTGAMDKTLKITSLTSSTVVQVYNTNAPVWSCCWNQEDVNYLFAGLSNGTILVYDTRNTSEEVLTLNRDGSKHPIVAMNYVPKSEGSRFPCSGILVGTLSNCSFWEQTSSVEFKPHILPLEGNCISLSFEQSTRHCLASFRPNKTYPSMRHVMCELLSTASAGQTEPGFKCNPIQSYFGGSTVKLLARSSIFRRPNTDDRLLIAAGDEGSSSLDLWDSNSGTKVQHLMSGATIIDVCPFRFNNCDYLGALSEKVIKLYKWQP